MANGPFLIESTQFEGPAGLTTFECVGHPLPVAHLPVPVRRPEELGHDEQPAVLHVRHPPGVPRVEVVEVVVLGLLVEELVPRVVLRIPGLPRRLPLRHEDEGGAQRVHRRLPQQLVGVRDEFGLDGDGPNILSIIWFGLVKLLQV